MELVYKDKDILVCVKPPRVLSTDEAGGVPELARQALGDPNADVRTVHRLDRVVGGLMVLARNPSAAAELSRQIRENTFQKEYLAVVHGCPSPEQGTFRDLLLRNKQERKTYVVTQPERFAQEAILEYRVLARAQGLSRVHIRLLTGRTHQIRAQFSSRELPLVGDRKYSLLQDDCEIALWSYRLAFTHPVSKETMEFTLEPPQEYPWSVCK